jgi:hypothetical protein
MTFENGNKPGAANAPHAALYIASFAIELARLAKSHDLDALAYILDMARLEADQIAKRWSTPQGVRHAFEQRRRQGARTPMRSRKARLG